MVLESVFIATIRSNKSYIFELWVRTQSQTSTNNEKRKSNFCNHSRTL